MVKNGNTGENGWVIKEYFMVEKNGRIFYFLIWNRKKW